MKASKRRTDVADGAIAVLAERGARGLTHRAVDVQVGLPDGSTSYYYRTRSALLAAAATRLVELDLADVRQLTAGSEAVGLLGGLAPLLERWSGPAQRNRLSARFELFLEAGRNESLRDVLREPRAQFIAYVEAFLSTHGLQPARSLALSVNAMIEGLLLAEVSGFGELAPTTLSETLAPFLQPTAG